MPPPRTRMRGVIPRRAQVLDAAASATGRTRLRRRSSRREPPPSFYLAPGLGLPHLDSAVVALDGAAHAAWQVEPRRRSRYQIPGMVYCTLNVRATRLRMRASVHRWSWYPRPAARHPAPHPAPPAAADPAGTVRPGPWTPARPCPQPAMPAATAAPTLTDTQLSSDHRRRHPLLESLHGLQPDLLRRLRPSAVNPPPCPYRIHPAYRQEQHLSLHRTSLIKGL